jgi:hypothetical protein
MTNVKQWDFKGAKPLWPPEAFLPGYVPGYVPG